MAEKTLKTRLVLAANTMDYWLANDKKPKKGEACLVVDENNQVYQIRYGDGVNYFADLPVWGSGETVVSVLNTPTSSDVALDVIVKRPDGTTASLTTTVAAATTAIAGVMTTADRGTLNNLKSAAFLDSTTAVNDSTSAVDTLLPTEKAVATFVESKINELPTPMVFKGTVGAGGTIEWSNFPPSGTAEGDTYKVITDHATTPVCKVGDTIIYNGSEWVIVPSGDEPSGTVTSVGISTQTSSVLSVSGGPVTSSGTLNIDHAVSGVTTGSYGDGTHVAKITVDDYGHVTSATTVAIPSATTAVKGITKKPSSGDSWVGVDSNNVITHSAPGLTTTSYGSNTVIPTLKVDAKGHVSSVTTVSIPSATTAAEGLTKLVYTDTTAAITINDNKISHNTSGATAGTYGDATHVAQITVDDYGHVTSATTAVITQPNAGLTVQANGTSVVKYTPNTPTTVNFKSGFMMGVTTVGDAITYAVTQTYDGGNATGTTADVLILDGNF